MTRGPAARSIIWLIRAYQRLSRVLPPACRYQPTCSEYTRQSVELYGAVRGLGMGMLRILRCHPFAKGGYDPVPGTDPAGPVEPNDKANA